MTEPLPDIDVLGRALYAELLRRAGDPQTARNLPGTHLMTLFQTYQKHLEKKLEIEQAKLAEEKLDPMEMIDQPGLPLDLRVQILYEYTDELEDTWRKASAKLEELLKEAESLAEAAQVS